ncbi:NADH dehydrogenase-like protein YjlD [Rubripirellula amarantea]|uniref:NADH dehydrogenase-like protein YjlD n=1 Tax=Rubripirellula amarantea TaxID=2527999 RepID=A0A5C5WHM9_9BACT|nr:FAD-dependent oxidoreductase [Rubripirellula amarantea]TWT49302.1 NADH dehydrogenase-like protein YjlD [Rubripirellula amarantea]
MTSPTKHLVLLGIGHTNAHVVKEWAVEPIPNCSLTCISKFPTATYSGMLPGTLGGQFSDNEMRIDLRKLADHAGARLILADTCGLDLTAGEVLFSDHESIPFDALSVGVGSMPAGWQQLSESSLMVPIKPMQTFLSRLDDRLQNASFGKNVPLRVAIVGGGVASVEIAFCLNEQISKRHSATGIQGNVKIDIFTSSDRIADGMRERSIAKIEKLLTARNIPVHAGHRIVEVNDTDVVRDDGQRFPADCVIWATGAAAPPVLGKLGLQTDERGFIATSQTLQSLTDPRIFAVGDSGTVIQSPSPKAGVYAVRQCPILWNNLHAHFSGKAMRKFEPQSDFLKLLNTGDTKALLEYGWFTVHARWCWKLKTWIDRKFVDDFQDLG